MLLQRNLLRVGNLPAAAIGIRMYRRAGIAKVDLLAVDLHPSPYIALVAHIGLQALCYGVDALLSLQHGLCQDVLATLTEALAPEDIVAIRLLDIRPGQTGHDYLPPDVLLLFARHSATRGFQLVSVCDQDVHWKG